MNKDATFNEPDVGADSKRSYCITNACKKIPCHVLRMHKPALGEFIHYLSCTLKSMMQIRDNYR